MSKFSVKTSHVLVAALILVIGVAGIGGAANGGFFKLGKGNSASKITTLKGTGKNYSLKVTNKKGKGAITAQASKGPAAQFKSPSGSAPFTVSSSKTVDDLTAESADNLGGKPASRYAALGARVESTGAVSGAFASYGLNTSQGGGDGVDKIGAVDGTYRIWLTSPVDLYILNATSIGNTLNFCAIQIPADQDLGSHVDVICRRASTETREDTSFFISGNLP